MLHFSARGCKTRPTCSLEVHPLATVRGKSHILMYSHNRRPSCWPVLNSCTHGQWTFCLQATGHSAYRQPDIPHPFFLLFFCGARAQIGQGRHLVEVYGSMTPMNDWSFRHRSRHLHDTQRNTKDKHPCSQLDSNPRSQRWSGFRLTPWTAQQPDRFVNPLKNFIIRPFYSAHCPTWYYIYLTSAFLILSSCLRGLKVIDYCRQIYKFICNKLTYNNCVESRRVTLQINAVNSFGKSCFLLWTVTHMFYC